MCTANGTNITIEWLVAVTGTLALPSNPAADAYVEVVNGDGSTTSTLMLTSVDASHRGQYFCRANGTSGSVESAPATLTVGMLCSHHHTSLVPRLLSPLF